ncbi:hypothetical protein [Fibrobacter sp.]|uniref:hypothetical protein n=1 Tax=Fibrobacter sp. TaxID=35828 RepID=UPI0025B7C98F|nr:hypothetical protein [Fibrobacter sp.]MBR3071897.1 hypothetical protein [Fibrobacter sp.]
MRILFLVLLLILNVYAEAKSSGSVQSGKQTKKAQTAVVAPKATAKAGAKSQKTKKSKTTTVKSIKSAPSVVASQESPILEAAIPETVTPSLAEVPNNVVVVRDTVVDTVYVVTPDTAELKQNKDCYNIPLPHQSAFLGKGFSVGIGAGLFNASKDCDCLGVWQGQLEFHYKDYITGGFDVRFFGGTLDRDVMLLYQRYRLNTRFHKSFAGADFYIAALLGLESTDLSEFRKEIREGVHKDNPSDSGSVTSLNSNDGAVADPSAEPIDDDGNQNSTGNTSSSSDKGRNCEKMFSLDGFTLGVEVGMGVVLSRYFGLIGGASYEFNFSWTQLVTFTPGIAFNLHEVWPWANKNLRSTWISFEMVFQRYFNRDVNEWALAGFLGLQFGI